MTAPSFATASQIVGMAGMLGSIAAICVPLVTPQARSALAVRFTSAASSL